MSCGFPGSFDLQSVSADLGAGDDRYILVGYYAQVVNGGPGNDNINTGAQDDTVHGDDGNDYVAGGPGRDRVFGDAGGDDVRGGNDGDDVDGGSGRDVLAGDVADITEDGSDRIASRDGEADQISCGFGADVVTADDKDVTESSQCESVDVQAVGGGGDDDGRPALALSVKKSVKIAKATKKPGYPIGILAGEDGTLSVKLTISAITARKFGLGKRTLVLDSLKAPVAADTYAVGLWATGKNAVKLRALARRPGFSKIPALITAKLTNGAGASRTKTAKVSLTR